MRKGRIDAHLLAAAVASRETLWMKDRRLADAANRLGVADIWRTPHRCHKRVVPIDDLQLDRRIARGHEPVRRFADGVPCCRSPAMNPYRPTALLDISGLVLDGPLCHRL